MSAVEEEWLRPVDLLVDSYAPDQIAAELGARLGLYVREAQRLVHEGLVPDERGLRSGIAGEVRRYLRSQPWLADPRLAPTIATVEETALAALHGVVASAPTPAPAPSPSRPVRRMALQPSATVVGNMAVRKRQVSDGLELSWDHAANVSEWSLRVSVRPDPRQDYVEGEAVALPSGTTSYVVELDERPSRIQLYGSARDGRVVRRVVVSALTSGNSGSAWKRQATAS